MTMRTRLLAVMAAVLLCCSIANAQDVYVNGNVLTFSSIPAYDAYAGNEADRSVLSSLARESSGLTTLEERNGGASEDDLYPEFLTQVLNEDLIMGISHFLVKVDLYNGR